MIKKILFAIICSLALAGATMAQKQDDKNRPPKNPPTSPAPDKDKPRDKPKDSGNSNRPKPNEIAYLKVD
jgi:hypothetical protein